MSLESDPETVTLTRLKTRADFLRVTRARNSAGMPGLVLQSAPRPTRAAGANARSDDGLGGDRVDGKEGAGAGKRGESAAVIGVGFTASRKVGNAVARNRAKRRLRALSASVLPRHAAPGRDYVLIARQTTAGRPYAALRGDLVRALKKLKVWRDAPAAR